MKGGGILDFAHILYHYAPGLERYLPPPTFFGLFISMGLGAIFYLGTRERRLIPRGLQNIVEFAVEALDRYVQAVLGRRDPRVLPFTVALFIFIVTCNLAGLVPGFEAPTANWSTTLALTLVAVGYYHFQGIRAKGLKGYLKSFVHGVRIPGFFGALISAFLLGLSLVIEVADHFMARPLSLSVRLFGNMFAKEVALSVFYTLPVQLGMPLWALPGVVVGLSILVGFTMFIGLIASIIQAFIFVTLALVWYQMAVGPEH
ncbi:MAG TPA: F0F1 ATP synthase subunit A [Armatimonadetes bacterium]|nr:F0F1 ATP synthase subunit A [Armatimonadota bacterium]